VATAWFTGAGGRQSVYGSFSSDGGKTFGAPLAISADNAIGRVDVVLLDADTALVSWLQQTGAAAELRGRILRRDGSVAPSVKIADAAAARAAGFPRMTRVGHEVLIAWTETGTQKRVRVARMTPE
jgi:hypothetical protein